jgi:hypothetical protein
MAGATVASMQTFVCNVQGHSSDFYFFFGFSGI